MSTLCEQHSSGKCIWKMCTELTVTWSSQSTELKALHCSQALHLTQRDAFTSELHGNYGIGCIQRQTWCTDKFAYCFICNDWICGFQVFLEKW